MKTKTGLWIDHRRAVIVYLRDSGEEVKEILSKTEKQKRRTGGNSSFTSFDDYQTPAEDRQENEYKSHINIYYEKIISHLLKREDIYVFGPGEAKVELKKRMQRHKLDGRISEIEPADRMTDPQIVAKVKTHFHRTRSELLELGV